MDIREGQTARCHDVVFIVIIITSVLSANHDDFETLFCIDSGVNARKSIFW